MGFGEFGSNGSVHWRIVHTADERARGFVRGRDPNLAKPSSVVSHVAPEEFIVRLRFPDPDRARRALQQAIESIDRRGTATVKVPAIKRRNPDDREKLPWEINVRW